MMVATVFTVVEIYRNGKPGQPQNSNYNRKELRKPSVWIFSVPLSIKRISKCTVHVNDNKLCLANDPFATISYFYKVYAEMYSGM